MSAFTETDIKEQAVTRFIVVVGVHNKSLGKRLMRNRGIIYSKAIQHIQRIGLHDYATLVLQPKSEERSQLVNEIERVTS